MPPFDDPSATTVQPTATPILPRAHTMPVPDRDACLEMAAALLSDAAGLRETAETLDELAELPARHARLVAEAQGWAALAQAAAIY